jgi:hypothetical protein
MMMRRALAELTLVEQVVEVELVDPLLPTTNYPKGLTMILVSSTNSNVKQRVV